MLDDLASEAFTGFISKPKPSASVAQPSVPAFFAKDDGLRAQQSQVPPKETAGLTPMPILSLELQPPGAHAATTVCRVLVDSGSTYNIMNEKASEIMKMPALWKRGV